MRISAANNPYLAGRASSTSSTPGDKASDRQLVGKPGSRYHQGPDMAVIEAEYVEAPAASTGPVFNQPPVDLALERSALDSRLEVENASSETGNKEPARSKTAPYALAPHQAPPPGTYLDIFA